MTISSSALSYAGDRLQSNYEVCEDDVGKFVKGLTTELSVVYDEPSMQSSCIELGPQYELLRVLGVRGDDYKIRCKSQYGYVSRQNVLLADEADQFIERSGNFQPKVLVLRKVNVAGAGVQGVIGTAKSGEVFNSLGRFGVSVKVEYECQDGYAYLPASDVEPFYDVNYHEFSDINTTELLNQLSAQTAALNRALDLLSIQMQNEGLNVGAGVGSELPEDFNNTVAYAYECIPEDVSELRKNVVRYALQFVGNPYVWGGTDLNTGADCSGFCQSVLRQFGIEVSRCSYTQCNDGRPVDFSELQPGDLIFYKRGLSVGHVTMYVGNGKVVQARGKDYGICITDYDYSTPCFARNVID